MKQALEVPIVEVKAIIFGLQLALQIQATNVTLESDNAQVISKIKSKMCDGSYLGVVIREILKLVDGYNYVNFVHMFREANEAAHVMAHLTPH